MFKRSDMSGSCLTSGSATIYPLSGPAGEQTICMPSLMLLVMWQWSAASIDQYFGNYAVEEMLNCHSEAVQ